MLFLFLSCAVPTTAPSPAAPADPYEGLDRFSLPWSETGSHYCFDSDSPELRAALTAPRAEADDPIDAAALADDLLLLHQILKDQYAGYPEMLQSRSFDPDRFFGEWRAALLAGPPPDDGADRSRGLAAAAARGPPRYVPAKRNYFDSPREGVGFPVDFYLPSEQMDAPVSALLPALRSALEP